MRFRVTNHEHPRDFTLYEIFPTGERKLRQISPEELHAWIAATGAAKVAPHDERWPLTGVYEYHVWQVRFPGCTTGVDLFAPTKEEAINRHLDTFGVYIDKDWRDSLVRLSTVVEHQGGYVHCKACNQFPCKYSPLAATLAAANHLFDQEAKK